jgi:hypothetical protein
MGDFRRGERYGGVAAASAFVHWVEDGQFSPRSERCFSRGWLTPPLRMYRAWLLQRQRQRCTIPVHASGERRLHAVGKCVSTAQDVDLNLFQDRPSAPCSGEIRFDSVLLSDWGSGAPFPFTPAVNVGSMQWGNTFRQRAAQRLGKRCTIPVHASGERRLHAVGKCVSTAQDVDLNLFQDWPSAPCGWEMRFDSVPLSDWGTRCVPWSVTGGAIPGGVVRLEPRALRL